MIQIVVKRDGRVVGYNEEKIMAAIRKAMLQTEMGEDEALIHKICLLYTSDAADDKVSV